MSFSENTYNPETLKQRFKILYDKLSELCGKDLSKTKLGQYQKELNALENEIKEENLWLINIIIRYVGLLPILYNAKIKQETIKKIIKGAFQYTDDEDFNNYFFELEMANRFITDNPINIDLMSNNDIIIDEKICIECKYIHSARNLSNNVEKAVEQIQKSKSKIGIISLDITNILPLGKIKQFNKDILGNFIKDYQDLLSKENQLKHNLELTNENISDFVMSKNNHFKNIIMSYFQSTLESVFWSNIKPETLDLINKDPNILGIFYQARYLSILDYNGEIFYNPQRILTCYQNNQNELGNLYWNFAWKALKNHTGF